MWFGRMCKKIVLMPVLAIVWLLRLAVSLVVRVYGFMSFWFWILLAIITVMTIVQHKWSQTAIMAVLGAISFVLLFASVWLEVALEDLEEAIKAQ